MASTDTKDADPGVLLELWKHARLEYDAAGHLLLADGRGLDRSIALHLLRGWHALATVQARLSGLPDPEFELFAVDRESELLEPIAAKGRSSWEESFNTIRQAALAEPWKEEPHEVDQKTLKLQLRLLGRCIAGRRGEVMGSGWSWKRLLRMRLLLTAAGAVVLILVAIGLARRLEEYDDEPLYPDFAQIAEPITVTTDVNQLSDFTPRGHPWDGSGTVIFRDRLVVTFGDTRHPEVISVGLDGNDRYSLGLMQDDAQVGVLEVGPSASHGLEVYTVTVPEEASVGGFNSIVIQVLDGDGAHSIGHLLLNEPGDDPAQ